VRVPNHCPRCPSTICKSRWVLMR